jgi:hypothetical protein
MDLRGGLQDATLSGLKRLLRALSPPSGVVILFGFVGSE